jgi:hypothetical protein
MNHKLEWGESIIKEFYFFISLCTNYLVNFKFCDVIEDIKFYVKNTLLIF